MEKIPRDKGGSIIMADIRDVAKKANVSNSTVSRVLSEHAFVEPKTKERVLQAMKELNYRPHLAARFLKQGNSKMIGLLIPDIMNPYYPELVKSIEQVAVKAGYSMILCETLGSAESESHFLKVLSSLFVDGIIFISSTNRIDHVKSYINTIPIVFLNRSFDVTVPCININNEKASYDAINYLIAHGHKKISLLINNTERQYNQERFSGAKKAFQEHGINDFGKYIMKSVDSVTGAYDETSKLLEMGDKPTAIFLFNDYLAFGVYRAITKKGLSIPKDISVMGFDDTLQVQYLTPPLTTIRHPSAEHAQFIFDTLMKERAEPGKHKGITYFEGKIIERESVCYL